MSLETFTVPRWLRSAHLQTLGAALPLWSSFRARPAELIRYPLPGGDGALYVRAWWQPGKARTVVIVHGVGGTSESKYVLRAGVSLYRAGFHVVRLNLRGAGEGIRDAPSLYHGGLTEDLSVTVEALSHDPRVADIALVGFSLGGNVSLKMAGEWGSNVPKGVRAVAALSAPLNLVEVSRAFERWRAYPYSRYVLRHLIAQATEFRRLHPARAKYDRADLRRLGTVRAYDDCVVAPMHGFEGSLAYYRSASSGPLLRRIEVPTLLVHAADDPMVPDFTVRPWLKELPRSVRVAWSEWGGHVGWFGGLSEDQWVETWAMRRVLRFLGEEC
jgi:predicted alpha/beta-fold hydrolase